MTHLSTAGKASRPQRRSPAFSFFFRGSWPLDPLPLPGPPFSSEQAGAAASPRERLPPLARSTCSPLCPFSVCGFGPFGPSPLVWASPLLGQRLALPGRKEAAAGGDTTKQPKTFRPLRKSVLVSFVFVALGSRAFAAFRANPFEVQVFCFAGDLLPELPGLWLSCFFLFFLWVFGCPGLCRFGGKPL